MRIPGTPSIRDQLCLCGLAAGLMLVTGHALAEQNGTADAQSPIAKLQKDAPKNWDKWGNDDQVGTLNYLDDKEVMRGIGAVKQGRTFTLQIPMTHGDGPVFPGRIATRHYMSQDESNYSSGKADPAPGGMKFSDDVTFMYL